MKTQQPKDMRFPRILLLIFIITVVGIITGGYLYYRNYENHYRTQVENQLSSIAQLKVDDILKWRQQRLGDGNALFKNATFYDLVQHYFENSDDRTAQERIRAWLNNIQSAYSYERVFLLDIQGVERVSVPGTPETVAPHLAQDAADAIKSGRVTLLDFHRDTADGQIYLSILIPILGPQEGGQPLGVVVLRIDPNQYLYPLISQWPTPSQTAETYLVRRDGDDALMLNERRFKKDTALNMRVPLTLTYRPSVMAVIGQQGIVQSTNYRGVSVIADLQAVPDSPWFMIASMDTSELYAPIRHTLWLLIVLVGALLIGAGGGVGLAWRQQSFHFYREKAEIAEALRASEEKYRITLDSMMEGCQIIDFDWRYIYLNDTAVKHNHQSKEKLLGRTMMEVYPGIEDSEMFANLRRCMEARIPHRMENLFTFPNGSENWFELSMEPIPEGIFILSIDATARKQAEHTLKYSEVKYRRLFEAARDGILILDADTGQIVDANPFLTDMLGYSREELLGKELWQIGPFKDIEASRAVFQELQSQGYVRYEHLPLQNKSGQRMAVEFVSNVYMVNSQRVIQCNIRDITRRVQMKNELQESEARYKELAESISDVFFALDEDLRYIYWNKASEKLTGIPDKDALGKRLHDIFPDSKQARMAEKAYKKALRTKKPQYFVNEYRLQGKDFSFEISAYPSKSGLSVFFKDVTKSKRIEKRLWDSMSNFYKVINDDPDGIIITNREGIVRYVNPAAESLFGKKSKDFIRGQFGRPISLSGVTEIDIIREAGEIVVAEMRVGETMWYDESAYLISLNNISERKQAHQAQERLSQQLQAKVSELETFSYGIAHDLKSPMVSIGSFSRLLREDIQNQKLENVQEDIRLLESGVRKMEGFLNSTLEYSHAGQLKKRTKDVSFSEIVNEAMTEFNEQISSIGATVATAKTFPMVYVDKAMIIQVLADLIQNSIKYRDKTVPLKIEIGYQPSEGEAVFFVRDNGPGIDASEAEKVFALFYRGTADGEGSGIGLAIVKKIIEAHGGRIWVQQGQSVKGTTMCFTLPLQHGTNKENNNGKD